MSGVHGPAGASARWRDIEYQLGFQSGPLVDGDERLRWTALASHYLAQAGRMHTEGRDKDAVLALDHARYYLDILQTGWTEQYFLGRNPSLPPAPSR